MAGENDSQDFDPEQVAEDDGLVIDETDEEVEVGEAQRQLSQAAAAVEFVVLPLAVTNEGKGAPIAMGIQRWWAQEVTKAGTRAAAPVFTALARNPSGQEVPALMVYRDGWTDERALEGITKFPNAKRALIPDFHVADDKLGFKARLVDVVGEGENIELTTVGEIAFDASPAQLPEKIHETARELAARQGQEIEEADWKVAFGTQNDQAMLSFLVGLGNLSALQGRVVPATSDQLLNPLVDAINRDPDMDAAAEALHAMTDILIGGQPDRASVPLSVQALSIGSQKRPKDKHMAHHLALVLRRLGDVPSAINAFNQAFNLDPADAQIAANFVHTLKGLNDLDNALKVAQFALERGNESAVVMAQLGNIYIERDEFDQAEPFLRRAIDDGKVPSAYGDLANVLWDRSDDDDDQAKEDRQEAVDLLRTAIGLPQIAKSTLDMLLDLYEEEDLDEAREILEKAVDEHPESATVLMAAANMYIDADETDAARPILERILALPRRGIDDDAFARRQLLSLTVDDFEDRYDTAVDAINGGDSGATAEAAKFMREVIAQDQLYWQPHLMLALAVRTTEGDEAALAHLGNAVRLRPNDAQIRELLAAILRKQGRPREAVEHLRALVSINPREIEPVAALAATMRDANMFDESRQVCETALQMVPNHPEFTKILNSLPKATQA